MPVTFSRHEPPLAGGPLCCPGRLLGFAGGPRLGLHRSLFLRSPESLHSLRLLFALSGCEFATFLLSLWLGVFGNYLAPQRCRERPAVRWRSSPALGRSLKSFYGPVQLVSFCNQKSKDLFCRHRKNLITDFAGWLFQARSLVSGHCDLWKDCLLLGERPTHVGLTRRRLPRIDPERRFLIVGSTNQHIRPTRGLDLAIVDRASRSPPNSHRIKHPGPNSRLRGLRKENPCSPNRCASWSVNSLPVRA